MNQFNTTSMITTIAALITTIVLFAWAIVDAKSIPYSWLAAGWTAAIFLVFAVLWNLSKDGYQPLDIMFMSNAVPGVILWSLVSLFIIGVNELRIHLSMGNTHGRNS